MSWEAAYSFGASNAQPPTPTKTPNTATFPSPTFQTPKNSSSFENRSGWTPTFAEEYSVFNATPGRLTVHNHFAETPRPPASERRRLASTGDLAEEIASHVHHISSGPPPAVDPSNQLLSSGGLDSSRSRFDDFATVTPQKPKKHLDEAFSGQTATPPHSASKGSRKIAPKLSTRNMQYDTQESQFGQDGISNQQHLMAYPQTTSDMFGYPLSAPATAPAFGAKPFWDNDTSMSGMDMDFVPENSTYNPNTHRTANSFDWGRSNQIFQETTNVQRPQDVQQPIKRQRALAPKAPVTSASQPSSLTQYDMSSTITSSDPFSATGLGLGVDPGLLFSRPSSSTTNTSQNTGFEDVLLPATRPSTSQVTFEPYQHQLRESRRDQEELRRSRSTRENGSFRFDRSRGTASSPVRGSARPGMHRSMSDSKGKRIQAKRNSLTSSGSTRKDDRSKSRTGRSSPVKQARLTSLKSIPESPDRRSRTEVKFTIDANGRARTETIVVRDESKRRQSVPSILRGNSWGSSSYESSSDDEPIIIPSQNNSFALPTQRHPSVLSRFEGSNSIPDGRRSSASGSSYNRSESSRDQSSRLDGNDSEAETVMDDEDGAGDASRELRKLMENRKQLQPEPRNTRHHRYASDSRGVRHAGYGSSATSPTDFEGATPSSTRSGTTRCVCNKADGDGFMIQCESCDNWLHALCVGIDRRSLPPVYICAFCANTPNNVRGLRKATRGASNLIASPLAHKSFKSFR